MSAHTQPPADHDFESLIEVDNDAGVDLGEPDLEFHDFHSADGVQGKIPGEENRRFLERGAPPSDRPVSIWTVRYYQKYFNVETADVVKRCAAALYPKSYFVEIVGDNPDLYGPFWIASTVVIVLTFSSTLAGAAASHLAGVRYEYKFGLLSAAAALMYGYTFVVPLVLWAVLKYYKSEHANVLECVTLYGYANTIWVPVSLVSISPIEIFDFPTISNVVRWLSAAVGCAVSTTFLVRNLYPVLNSTEARTSRILLVAVVAAQLAFALVVKIVFFAYSIEDDDD
ncbi:uncharacterized protein V1510DRAFT_377519 [Dipodascopsis tothii]|uniref:uncharacterized protein n=1 Tax=Dipodascopsis tothii TaxID=44089 RepID=UPI0034CE716B